MNLFEFMRSLESFYPLNESQEKVNNRLSSYVDILEGEIVKSGKKYDFDKILKHIQMNYRYKTFPSLPDILEYMEQGVIKEVVNCKDEGCLVVVKLPNGRIYTFEVATFGKPLEDIKKHARQKFVSEDDWKQGKDVEVNIYPAGSVLMGDKVYTP